MNQVLFSVGQVGVTPWKIIGYIGGALFSARWLVQFYASRACGRPTLPITFWYMSLVGSVMTLSYFIFGKNDSVGILQNIFPCFIAAYNVFLEFRRPKTPAPTP